MEGSSTHGSHSSKQKVEEEEGGGSGRDVRRRQEINKVSKDGAYVLKIDDVKEMKEHVEGLYVETAEGMNSEENADSDEKPKNNNVARICAGAGEPILSAICGWADDNIWCFGRHDFLIHARRNPILVCASAGEPVLSAICGWVDHSIWCFVRHDFLVHGRGNPSHWIPDHFITSCLFMTLSSTDVVCSLFNHQRLNFNSECHGRFLSVI
ncbi:hypothetical protein Cgig2_028695 [Carnegiea gigantea]|uniref:Uncharacterized protein n=1 Tax=Carnegiea gigantea TaxID=171969 RepID=A0A9Q1QGE2_9CARY|nr:hypothetical protein Cgig2_028695 [Carnegiea gigantea]